MRTRKSSSEATHTSEAIASEEIVVIEKAASHSHATEWVHTLLLLSRTIIIIVLLLATSVISEEVIIVISEEITERISATKRSSKNLVSLGKTEPASHVVLTIEPIVHASKVVLALARRGRRIKSLFAIFVKNCSLFFI